MFQPQYELSLPLRLSLFPGKSLQQQETLQPDFRKSPQPSLGDHGPRSVQGLGDLLDFDYLTAQAQCAHTLHEHSLSAQTVKDGHKRLKITLGNA